jgi:hypothetical protein
VSRSTKVYISITSNRNQEVAEEAAMIKHPQTRAERREYEKKKKERALRRRKPREEETDDEQDSGA